MNQLNLKDKQTHVVWQCIKCEDWASDVQDKTLYLVSGFAGVDSTNDGKGVRVALRAVPMCDKCVEELQIPKANIHLATGPLPPHPGK